MGNEIQPKIGISDFLTKYMEEFRKVLPKQIPVERFGRIILTEFRKNPKLAKCSTPSILGALMMCAETGLMPGASHHSYLIPRKNSQLNSLECNFEEGYKGLLHLGRQAGLRGRFFVGVVYEKDKFSFSEGTTAHLSHERASGDRGKKIWAYAGYQDGDNTTFVVYDEIDIQKRRSVSKATSKYSPWSNWEDEMWIKTVVKPLMKLLPMSYENRLKIEADQTTRHFKEGEYILEGEDITDWDRPLSAEEEKQEKKYAKEPPVIDTTKVDKKEENGKPEKTFDELKSEFEDEMYSVLGSQDIIEDWFSNNSDPKFNIYSVKDIKSPKQLNMFKGKWRKENPKQETLPELDVNDQ